MATQIATKFLPSEMCDPVDLAPSEPKPIISFYHSFPKIVTLQPMTLPIPKHLPTH
ncbi:hypothetical protein K435DRAFT_780318 [Dendrothele bispora CBS 962.96]|uniref:Uncharacterized protein n=1 Tax=Dendrothele bispora (strain CBS 962.96) TaxID=1314807 RepID=A0A4S8LSI2_DENBC|nr:hypothetical protein K435DRAFT_780318 [Dendrothele bispora CBS 962.96]